MWQPRLLGYGLCSSGVGPAEDPEAWLVPYPAARILEMADGLGAPPSMAELACMLRLRALETQYSALAGTHRHSSIERSVRNFAMGCVGASVRDKLAGGHSVNQEFDFHRQFNQDTRVNLMISEVCYSEARDMADFTSRLVHPGLPSSFEAS